MSVYGQYCPVARATEILGERWTLLVVRELFMGSSRFSDFQRGLPKMSPTLLNKRLSDLEAANILYKKKAEGQKGYTYHLTDIGMALQPTIESLISWGMNWIESQFAPEELDIELLMFDIERSIDKRRFPGEETTLKFHFFDAPQIKDWWLIVKPEQAELCTKDPGKEPHVYITTCVRALTNVWMGVHSWQQALADSEFQVLGPEGLCRQLPHWLGVSRAVAFKKAG